MEAVTSRKFPFYEGRQSSLEFNLEAIYGAPTIVRPSICPGEPRLNTNSLPSGGSLLKLSQNQ